MIIIDNTNQEFDEEFTSGTCTLTTKLQVLLSAKSNKGFLAQEYHPFFNLRQDSGEITELITDQLNFSLQNPVEMIP